MLVLTLLGILKWCGAELLAIMDGLLLKGLVSALGLLLETLPLHSGSIINNNN
jgi:hypothetical protein